MQDDAAPADAGPRKPTSNPDAETRIAAEVANLPIEKFDMRLDSRKCLLYASTNIQRGGAADLAHSGLAVSAASNPGPVNPDQGVVPQPREGGIAPQINTQWWPVVRSTLSFPWRAVGWVEMYRNSQRWGYCSGSLYGPRMIVTAAHCLYDRSSNTWATRGYFSPNHYYTSAGASVKPFGRHSSKSFFWQTGWVSESTDSKAYLYDVSVWLLNTAPATGYLGFATSTGAYSAVVDTAGYPGDTVTIGNFHYSSTRCDYSDSNGNDAILKFMSASNPTCPRKNCPIAEPGQSGQPVWTTSGSTYNIRGVLSYGPLSYTTCTDWDVYTELNVGNAKFLSDNRMRK